MLRLLDGGLDCTSICSSSCGHRPSSWPYQRQDGTFSRVGEKEMGHWKPGGSFFPTWINRAAPQSPMPVSLECSARDPVRNLIPTSSRPIIKNEDAYNWEGKKCPTKLIISLSAFFSVFSHGSHLRCH